MPLLPVSDRPHPALGVDGDLGDLRGRAIGPGGRPAIGEGSRWFLTRDEIGLTLTQPKVNYARAGSQVTFQWDNAHQVFAVTGSYDEAPTAKASRPVLMRLIAEVLDEGANISMSPNATNNVFALIKARHGFPRGLDRTTVLKEIAGWRADGLVALEDYTQTNRRTGKRLVLTDAGLAEAQADLPRSPFEGLPAPSSDCPSG